MAKHCFGSECLGLGLKFWVGWKIRGDILGGGKFLVGGKILSQVEILRWCEILIWGQSIELGVKFLVLVESLGQV